MTPPAGSYTIGYMMKTQTTTFDAAALRLIMQGHKPGSPALRRLAAQARRAINPECPECGREDGIEDNGARRRSDLTFLCTGCGHQWDAEEV